MEDLPPDVTEREDMRWKGDTLCLAILAAVLLIAAVVHAHTTPIEPVKPSEAADADVRQPAR